jgi:hypothetical protein
VPTSMAWYMKSLYGMCERYSTTLHSTRRVCGQRSVVVRGQSWSGGVFSRAQFEEMGVLRGPDVDLLCLLSSATVLCTNISIVVT